MNPYQTARQLRALLLDQTMDESPSDPVFGAGDDRDGGSVRVSDGQSEKGIRELRMPFCLIAIGDVAEVDEEDPGLILQDFPIILVQRVEGDPMGERILMGGPGASRGKPAGKGLMELEVYLRRAVGRLTGADGARASVAYIGSPPAEQVQGFMIGSRKYTVRAWCTSEPHFDPPTRLVATASGGGAVALSWALPPARWDRRRIILRRAAGATAPASPTAGTGVTLSGDLATSVNDTPGAGQHSYSVWCAYTETGAAADEKFSSQELGTTRTVTAT